jgi:hypothetical protein
MDPRIDLPSPGIDAVLDVLAERLSRMAEAIRSKSGDVTVKFDDPDHRLLRAIPVIGASVVGKFTLTPNRPTGGHGPFRCSAVEIKFGGDAIDDQK